MYNKKMIEYGKGMGDMEAVSHSTECYWGRSVRQRVVINRVGSRNLEETETGGALIHKYLEEEPCKERNQPEQGC